ncbi:unnamed protein product [Hermetia illucens]|uniref:Chitin-binding type-2 domain-containing protein n=1 Tax=Hermetia illucens TaxID=343691 RepID=A0A7R8ULZ8_HERIL|nr:uncharacterized protein LOC119648358 [Hermetia illucens]CAD7083291.1 unnamed protein product [Hermetia illucens]
MEQYFLVLILALSFHASLGQIGGITSVTTRETNSCEDRASPGLICQSCQLLATCVQVNDKWMTVPVETCNEELGFYCNLNERGCSNLTGPCYPFGFEGNFACTTEGVFPDPYDCQKYHMCYKAGSTLVSANINCGGDRAYSASTGDCSVTVYDKICTEQQYICENAGDSGAWPGNNNIFYICKATMENDAKILYPTLYRCASGEVFNGARCVQKGGTGSVSPTVKPGGSGGSSGSSSRPTSIPGEFICTERGLQADPSDCRSYYFCSLNGTARRFTCPLNSYFNLNTKSCVFGRC